MFGERLHELRTEHGYSMDYLADIYNKKYNGKLNKSTISRYENGLQEPMLFVVNNLADLFSVSVDYLTGNEKPTPDSESGLDSSEESMLKLFRLVPPESRGMVLQMIEAALKSQGLL